MQSRTREICMCALCLYTVHRQPALPPIAVKLELAQYERQRTRLSFARVSVVTIRRASFHAIEKREREIILVV